MSRPLYEATKGGDREPFLWDEPQRKAFRQLKEALISAPTLGLLDLTKPFILYVHETRNVAVGVLVQQVGSWPRPVAYLSKQLDPVARGWPACLKSIAAAALVIKEADKLALGQELIVRVPHAVMALMEYKGNHWFTNARMLKYQAMLCENPHVKLEISNNLNPATLLPVEDQKVTHDCIQTMDQVYSSRPDLKDQPFTHADLTLFTDGSSQVVNGERRAGYSVVTHTEIIEAANLPRDTSAQKAELIGLYRALLYAKDRVVNLYTDSRYVFLTLHAHGALYKERGLITAGGKDIKHGPEILALLTAVWLPKQVAVMHCRGHQLGTDPIAKGNRFADTVAKWAALHGPEYQAETIATLSHVSLQDFTPHYTTKEDNLASETLKATKKKGWWILPDQRPFVPRACAWEIVCKTHEATHFGKEALATLILSQVYIDGVHQLTAAASAKCLPCARNNARQGPTGPPGVQRTGIAPFQCITTDFTEMPKCKGYKYMLVFIDTYSNWPEALPCRTEQAKEVAKGLLRCIIPAHGFPEQIGSDNGPAFVQEAVQLLAKSLGIDWSLHCAYCPESSGKSERVNRCLKSHLSKLCQETGLNWIDLLPLALFRIRCTP